MAHRKGRMPVITAFDENDIRDIPDIEIVMDCNRAHVKKKSISKVKPSFGVKAIYDKVVLDREPVKLTNLGYQPLIEMKNMKPPFGVCSNRELSPNLLYKEMGRISKNKHGLLILRLPKGTLFYKGARYFNDSMVTPSGRTIDYMWVGNPLVATTYAERFHGGIMVYRTTKQVDLLLLNESNCQKLYEMTPWNDTKLSGNPESDPDSKNDEGIRNDVVLPSDPLGPEYKFAVELKFGAGISLEEQINRAREFNADNKSSETHAFPLFKTRGFPRFTYCEKPEKTRDFGNMRNDILVASFVHLRREQLGVSGWFSPETYSPFHCALMEEILIFPSTLELVPKHPLFWKNWVEFLPFKRLPNRPFDINKRYTERNRGMQIFRYINECADRENDIKGIIADANAYAKRGHRHKHATYSYMTYNVFHLENPNALIDKDTTCLHCAELIKTIDADVVALELYPKKHVDMLKGYLVGDYLLGVAPESISNKHNRSCIVILFRQRLALGTPIVHEILSTPGANPTTSVMFQCGVLRIVASVIIDIASYIDNFVVLPMQRFIEEHSLNATHSLLHIEAIMREKPDVIMGSLGKLQHEHEIHVLFEHGQMSLLDYLSNVKGGTTCDNNIEDYIIMRCEESKQYVHKTVPFCQSPHKPVIAFVDEIKDT